MVVRMGAPNRDARTRCRSAPATVPHKSPALRLGCAGAPTPRPCPAVSRPRNRPGRMYRCVGPVVRSDRPVHVGRLGTGRLSGTRGAAADELSRRASGEPRFRSQLHARRAWEPGRPRIHGASLRWRALDLRRRTRARAGGLQREWPDADQVADFYAASAKAASRTDVLAETGLTVNGRQARRLDTKTGERLQTVVTWAAADPDLVNVVVTNDLPDERINDALAAFGNR